jgi:hypothetical protein
MIIANTSPRIIGFDFSQIELVNNKSVVIVRIPRSLYAPHMVSLDTDYRFYMRHPGGKHRMDVGELKHSFLQSANYVDRAKTWSDQRIELIKNGIGPAALEDGPILILHILPLAFSTQNPFSRDEVQSIRELGLLGLDYSAEGRYNVDG